MVNLMIILHLKIAEVSLITFIPLCIFLFRLSQGSVIVFLARKEAIVTCTAVPGKIEFLFIDLVMEISGIFELPLKSKITTQRNFVFKKVLFDTLYFLQDSEPGAFRLNNTRQRA